MKHAKEVIELMSSFPDKHFKMRHIVSYVRSECQHSSARQIRRVLAALEEVGSVKVNRPRKSGGDSTYKWNG